MTQKILLFKAFLIKELILMKRYLFNSLGGFITLYIIFLLMFQGYKGIAGSSPNFGEILEGLVVGYTLWILSMSVYQDITYSIQREAREGTLEQLYMSVHSFGWILAISTFVRTILSLIFVSVILFLLMLTTDKSLNIDILSLLILVFFTLLGILGIGYICGGLTLVFKRIDSYLQIVTFGLIGVIAAPVGKVPLFKLLPASWGASLIQDVMTDGKSIFDFSFNDLTLLVLIGVSYALLGFTVYKLCERKAMNKGMLGHY